MDQKTTSIRKDFARYYGADDHVLEKTWENFEENDLNTNALNLIRSLKFFKTPGAYIYGSAGSGKSHIMKAIFNNLLTWKVEHYEKGIQTVQKPYWIYMTSFLEKLRQEEFTVKKKAMEATVLFVDDLGASTKTDWVTDQIFQLIDHRTERKLQTYFTSNYNIEDLGKFYTGRIASRIQELCLPVKLIGADYRTQIMKQNFDGVKALAKQKKEKK